MTDPNVSELGKAVQEVSDKVGLLVREEIALAQAEMTEKIGKLIRGIVGRRRRGHLRAVRADLPAARRSRGACGSCSAPATARGSGS